MKKYKSNNTATEKEYQDSIKNKWSKLRFYAKLRQALESIKARSRKK